MQKYLATYDETTVLPDDAYLGCAFGIAAPEFLDIAVLQSAGYTALPCISVPSKTSDRSNQQPVVNLDGTPFPADPSVCTIETFEAWRICQLKELRRLGSSSDRFEANFEKAHDFLSKRPISHSRQSIVSVAALFVKAMIFALTDADLGTLVLHGECPPESGNEEVSDLTIIAFERLSRRIRMSGPIRVGGPSGVLVQARGGARVLVRNPIIDDKVIDMAMDSRACLVGPARFLLADMLGTHANIPWYLRPSQLRESPGDWDIKLTQVSHPFWCRWGDPHGLAKDMAFLPSYALWRSSAKKLLNASYILSAQVEVLEIVRGWMFGRRTFTSKLRFFDAAKEVKAAIAEGSILLNRSGISLNDPSMLEKNPILASKCIARIARALVRVGELNLLRAFCFCGIEELRNMSAKLSVVDNAGLPSLYLKVSPIQ